MRCDAMRGLPLERSWPEDWRGEGVQLPQHVLGRQSRHLSFSVRSAQMKLICSGLAVAQASIIIKFWSSLNIIFIPPRFEGPRQVQIRRQPSGVQRGVRKELVT